MPNRSDPASIDVLAAAKFGDAKSLARLIGAGADVDVRSDNGWTPTRVAAASGHADCLAMIKAHIECRALLRDVSTPRPSPRSHLRM